MLDLGEILTTEKSEGCRGCFFEKYLGMCRGIECKGVVYVVVKRDKL